MIRPVTCLCLLAACGSGLYLYSEKHQTTLLDRDIGRVIYATEAAHARTGILRAEWALLNEPGRLQDMSGRYLALHPMAPTQFVQVADLAAHLPAPVKTAPDAPADDDTPAVAALPGAAPAGAPPEGEAGDLAGTTPTTLATAATLASLPSHHPMQPAKTAPRLLAHADPKHAPHHITLADRQDVPMHEAILPHGTPLPLAAPQPIGARVYSAMARPMRLAAASRIVSAVPSYAQAVPHVSSALGSSALGSSALGGSGSLPPPVPYGR